MKTSEQSLLFPYFFSYPIFSFWFCFVFVHGVTQQVEAGHHLVGVNSSKIIVN